MPYLQTVEWFEPYMAGPGWDSLGRAELAELRGVDVLAQLEPDGYCDDCGYRLAARGHRVSCLESQAA